YAGNAVQTTKYTLLSFIPRNLFEQFHRFANLYFLGIVLLNWVPQINAFGKEVAMIPVLFVLGVTAIKDAFEDHRRICRKSGCMGTTALSRIPRKMVYV
ncbi:phospholipid-transporting ATPase, putative, partial [Ixodes scapularis]